MIALALTLAALAALTVWWAGRRDPDDHAAGIRLPGWMDD